jgi:acid phosphatase family membrane protein YuiD
MNWIEQLLSNRVIINGFTSWIAAQVLKTIIYAVIHKKIDWLRLLGGGGMPSSHSATVTAIAATCAIYYGLASFEFGVTVILAFIVMHDAMGVRLETGKQTKVINQLIEFIDSMGSDLTPEEKLKEFVGHTPPQVFGGILLGLTVTFVLR